MWRAQVVLDHVQDAFVFVRPRRGVRTQLSRVIWGALSARAVNQNDVSTVYKQDPLVCRIPWPLAVLSSPDFLGGDDGQRRAQEGYVPGERQNRRIAAGQRQVVYILETLAPGDPSYPRRVRAGSCYSPAIVS